MSRTVLALLIAEHEPLRARRLPPPFLVVRQGLAVDGEVAQTDDRLALGDLFCTKPPSSPRSRRWPLRTVSRRRCASARGPGAGPTRFRSSRRVRCTPSGRIVALCFFRGRHPIQYCQPYYQPKLLLGGHFCPDPLTSARLKTQQTPYLLGFSRILERVPSPRGGARGAGCSCIGAPVGSSRRVPGAPPSCGLCWARLVPGFPLVREPLVLWTAGGLAQAGASPQLWGGSPTRHRVTVIVGFIPVLAGRMGRHGPGCVATGVHSLACRGDSVPSRCSERPFGLRLSSRLDCGGHCPVSVGAGRICVAELVAVRS